MRNSPNPWEQDKPRKRRVETVEAVVDSAMARALDNYSRAPKSEKEPRMAQALNEANKNDAYIRSRQAVKKKGK